MEYLVYPLALIAMLGPIVTVHELGHYLIARRAGVRVVRFSIGFGRPLWSRVDRHGTEFVIAVFPLGGYVRMLDEHEPGQVPLAVPVKAGDIAYPDLGVWWRMAIASGGPLANLLLAAVVYWCLFVVGSMTYAPILGTMAPESPAVRAGLHEYAEIVAVDGQPVTNWQQVNIALAGRMGDTGQIEFNSRFPGGEVTTSAIPVRDWHRSVKDPDLFDSLGLVPGYPAVIATVLPDSAAQRDGLRPWDIVRSVDGEPVDTWMSWVELIQNSAGESLSVTLLRRGETLNLLLIPDTQANAAGEAQGYLGVGPYYKETRYGLLEAVPKSIVETWDKTFLTLSVVKKLVFGQVSVENLNSPIMIAKVAGDTAMIGWRTFLGLFALLSVSLGVFNLLPIPMLDGGHIIFCLAEIVRGRPLSEKVQLIGIQVGLFLVAGLFIIAIYNDITRLL